MVGGATVAAMEATTAVVARAVEREPATAEEAMAAATMVAMEATTAVVARVVEREPATAEEAMAAATVGVATVGLATGRAA